MKIISSFFTSIVFLAVGSSSFAAQLLCTDAYYQYGHLPIGTICTTKKGFDFRRETGGWRDLTPNGKMWYLDSMVFGKNQFDSEAYCASKNLMLPTGY